MDKKQSLELCAALSNAKGAPGFEDEVLTVLRRYGEGLGSFREDSLRNLYLSRSGNQGGRPMVQLDAHTDEVAFMVQAVKPNGTLRFTTLGGWVPSNIPAHRVWVQTAAGDYIPGVTASKPPHFMSEAERKAQPAVEDMSIDIGASSREEVLRDFRVRMAAPVVPDVTFEYQEKHDLMIGKAFDCRLGCASILRTLDNLRDKTLNVDVTGAFAVQEEMGTRGATVTANTVKPDLAIVFEGCPADDTVAEPYMIQTAIHKGPMLRHIDARMITNPPLPALCPGSGGGAGHPRAGERAHRRLYQRRAHPSVQPGRARHRHRHPCALHPYPLRHRRPQRRGERRSAGRRHFGADGRRADQPLLSPKAAPPWGRSFFVDPRKTVPYALYTSAKIRCPSWLFAVDLSPFPHIQP